MCGVEAEGADGVVIEQQECALTPAWHTKGILRTCQNQPAWQRGGRCTL